MHEKVSGDYLEIDLLLILKKIWKQKILIILLMAAGVGILFLYQNMFVKTKYSVHTKLFILDQDQEKRVTLQDLQLGSYLIKDYKEIIMSRDVIGDVIRREELDISPEEFARKMSVTSPADTRILVLNYTDTDPDRAFRVIESLCTAAEQKIRDVTKTNDVSVIEKPEKPTKPVSKNFKKKAVLVAFMMFMLVSLVIALQEIMDDRINGPEDVEDVLQMPLLGVIPSRRGHSKRGGKA